MSEPFKGWTRADGLREPYAPVEWPFGRLDNQAQQKRARAAATADYKAARARFVRRMDHVNGKDCGAKGY